MFSDLLSTYSKSDICHNLLNLSFDGEQGVDFDGVKREAHSLFWGKALEEYFEGTTTFVPRVGPDVDDTIFRAIG